MNLTGPEYGTERGTQGYITIITGLVLALVPIRGPRLRYPQRASRSTFGEVHSQAGRVADSCGFGGAGMNA